ncbi:MAG: geranylgeranyl reductase family protein [Candidatus Heimdallarchaeota archaeon]|nr:geranylgeranyl reductase family protein [Candidatus Heimdallarchaeota archaeon]MCK4769768.1 geranylgeranyl reductase family protein [Candidatus Heimdallarchaeota archaeon]
MTETYDVIVIGAGPAGISAALYCKKEGLKVLLVDKKEKGKIGDKVCGEAISKKTSHQVSEKLNIESPQKNEINAEIEVLVLRTSLPVDHIILPAIGYMINRHLYGQRLLDVALQREIPLLSETKVLRSLVKENKVIGVVVRNNKNEEIELYSSLIIDCSGILAIVRTGLPKDFEPLLNKKLTKADYASCYREIIELEENHDLKGKIVLQYEEDIPEPGYIWFFADGEKKLNCGTGFIKEGKHKDKGVKSVYFKAMEKYYPKGTYKTIDGRGGCVPIRPPLWNAVAPGLIIVGDAAYHTDPLTAEGHGPAMVAGCFAGEIATTAVKKKSFETENLWKYNELVFSDFGSDHARSRILTIALEKMGPKRLEFLLKRRVIKQADLTSEGILKKRTILSYLGIALRCFPRYSLLLLMKRAISISKSVNVLCKNYPQSPKNFPEWRDEMEKLYQQI